LVKDTEHKKSYVVFSEIIAQRPANLRLDVITSLGMHVARLTMNENTLSYILPREKKYFTGVPQPKVLKPILRIEADPRWILNLLFDTEPTSDGWECKRDAKNRLESCHSESGVELSWTERESSRKTVSVKTMAGEIQLQLSGFQPNVEVKDEMFQMKPPAGYRAFRIKD
jgi:hypothetical protein